MLIKINKKMEENKMSKVKLKKKVLKYKDYIVFETLSGDFEIWDHTFKTPTTWLCGIIDSIKEAKPFIDKCIINNKKAREERIWTN